MENSVLSPLVTVGKGARVSYSVLMPGATVDPGAVVEYAILGERCSVGKDCRIGASPDQVPPEDWGLTVLAPDCNVQEGRVVPAGRMLDQNGEEVSR